MDTDVVKVLVVDDELAVGLFLKSILERVPGVEVAEVITDSLEAVQQVDHHKAQVVFLDIDMPGLNGLDLACKLREEDQDLCLVFATAHPDHALEAFELYSFDYILKPFNEERIIKTMHRIKNRFSQPDYLEDDLIIFEAEGRQIILRPKEIAFIESRDHKTRVKTQHYHDLMINQDLQSLEERLTSRGFFRCHRSYLVNTSYIKMIDRFGYSYDIILNSGERIPLSRRHLAKLKSRMKDFSV